MPTLDDILRREALRRAPPSPEMQRAIDETVAEIGRAFAGACPATAPSPDGPPEKQPGPAMQRVWRDLVAKAQAPVLADLAAARAEVERVRAERDAYAEVLSDCAAALRQVSAHLLPGTVDMPVAAALHAPMASGESRDAVIAAADQIRARAGAVAEARIRALEETPRRVGAALDAAIRMDAILLMAGEMTAQERRTARAVADGIAAKVIAALDVDGGGFA